jgi:phage baseplate assembly protein W
MNVDYAYHFDGRGRTATTTHEEHVRDMIEQLLFTMPGERVMRPDFGSGLMQLVFAPVDDELASATQLLVQSALQQTLGNVIDVETVRAVFQDGVLEVSVQYVLKQTGQRVVDAFTREAP